jgi:ribosomal protein S7
MNYINILVKNLIKKGNKYKANQIVFSIMENIKKQIKKNSFFFFYNAINKLNLNVESISLNYFKKKNLKEKVRFSTIQPSRIKRKIIKFLINSSNLRYESLIQERLTNEIIDLKELKGLSMRNKKQILMHYRKLRPSAILTRKKRTRKGINRL